MIAADGRRIAYYITAHGYGHAVRSLEVIRNLMTLDPSLEVTIVSDLPRFLIDQNLDRPVKLRTKRLDVGLVQQDSLQFDLEATREVLGSFYNRRNEIIAEEVDFLSRNQMQIVVSDVPFIVFHAAAECGIQSIGLGNFTWDWIYRPYAADDRRWQPLIRWIKEGYGKCDLFLQLPMHGDCSVCSTIRDVPLIARRAKRETEETRKILGVKPDQKAYLISFYSLRLDNEALRAIEQMEHALFLYKHPLQYELKNGRSLDGLDLSYADVVAAMDGVITKPGYGIVADCLAHGAPMIYTDRGVFPEYEILVDAIKRCLTAVYVPSEDLYAGRWESAIRCLESKPRRQPDCRIDGAQVCAQIILNVSSFDLMTDSEEIIVMPIEESLDLHTFQPKEVKNLLCDYLEAAHQKGFREVRIIHGKGRGILRKTVHSVLANHPLVASFRQADAQSGGWGATNVVLTSRLKFHTG